MIPKTIGVSILKEEVWFNVFTILLLFFKSKILLKVSGAPVGPVRSWLLRDSARLRGRIGGNEQAEFQTKVSKIMNSKSTFSGEGN